MFDGFIAFSRGSFMLDFVAVALFGVVAVLSYSIYIVKYQRKYELHKKIQIVLAAVLLVVITFFELEIRLYGWRHLAEPSPYFETYLYPILIVHLIIAVSTVVLWGITIVGAFKNYSTPLRPNAYSPKHKILGKAAAIAMFLTAVTGWILYYCAFVAV